MSTKGWLSLFCVACAFPRAQAQNLSGTWQGVELHLPTLGYWPAVLTITEARNGRITGTLAQESGDDPTHTIRFQMDGRHTGSHIWLNQTRILYATKLDGSAWCQGYMECTYDAREERLRARTTFLPRNNCTNSTFDLFRVKLKSAATIPADTWSLLRVSGREVSWFADPALQQLVAKGSVFRTRLRKTTTFYLTQGFYPSRTSGPVPVTVRVVPAAPRPRPQLRSTPQPASAPMPLPAVLFRTGTAELLPSSWPTLTQLVKQLQLHPKYRLRIAGHTDRIGDAARNVLLSEQRAAVVRSFLVEKGITESRLEAIGYGHSRLLYPSPDLRNRRVEVEYL
jgi:OOP family OmpA-OmpF porin